MYIVGAGGLAKVAISIARLLGLRIMGLFDDNEHMWQKSVLGVPICGPISMVTELPSLPTVIAIGSNSFRKELYERFEFDLQTLIDPRAFIDNDVMIGAGSIICAGAVCQANAQIGSLTYVSAGASISHDCIVGDYAHIGPGARLTGSVSVGEGSMLGAGSVVLPKVVVGKWARVGAASVVTKEVRNNATVMGVPARVYDKK